MLLCQLFQNGLEPCFFRPLEGDRQAKPGGKAHQLLPGVGFVDVVAGAVREGLFDEVAAVGGGVHRNVLGASAYTALQDGFQGGKVVVVGGKAQVVDEQDELERVCRQLVHQVGDLVQLVLFHFYQPQPLGRKLVGNGLYRAGFAGTGIAVQQHIVGGHPGQQRLCVGDHLFPLLLVAGQLGKALGVGVFYRHKLAVLHREYMVLCKHTVALFAHLAHALGVGGGKVKLTGLPPGQESQFRPLRLLRVGGLEQLVQRQPAQLLQKLQLAVQGALQQCVQLPGSGLPHADGLGLQHSIAQVAAPVGGVLEQRSLKGGYGIAHRAVGGAARLHAVGQV